MRFNGRAQRIFVMVWLVALAMTVWPGSVLAQGDDEAPVEQRDPAFEQEIYDRLAEIDPDAVVVFQSATQAMDSGQFRQAKQDYERVLDLAPEFPDALRRLSYVEAELGNIQGAISLARRAFEIDATPVNQTALARALIYTDDPDNLEEALRHAREAVAALPDDDAANAALLIAAWANEDLDGMRQASETLLRVAPDYPLAHYIAGLIAADDEDWIRAEEELLRAEELGMPAEMIESALDDGISSEATEARWVNRGKMGLYAIGFWIGGMVVLFALGAVLSKLTLVTVQQHAGELAYSISIGERLVRRTYRLVIGITSLYYYISIPLLVLLVILVTAGIFYGFLIIGRIPVRLAFFIGIAALYTLYAVVKSVLIRPPKADLGRPLPRSEAPELWTLTEVVAERVGTRPIDAIYVVPGTTIAVTERGALLNRIRGNSQRCLILGLAALPGMTLGSFNAILSHEYGHFSHRDTAGGGIALQVRYSMHQMARGLAMSGQAQGYNPAWLFINSFYRIYMRITLGASRLQEILADRRAAMAYGSQNFIDGLKHIVRQGLIFDVQANREFTTAQQAKRELNNMYTLPPLEDNLQPQLDARIEALMERPTSAYDSHPAVQDRIRLVEQLAVPNPEDTYSRSVWELLPNADALQAEMTSVLQSRLRDVVRLAGRGR